MQPPHPDQSHHRPAMDIITRAEAQAQGLKHFFTGKPCKHGHLDQRLVSNRGCCSCAKEKQQLFRSENREATRERGRLDDKKRSGTSRRRASNIKGKKAFQERNPSYSKDYARKWVQERRLSDPVFRATDRLRTRLWRAVTEVGASKTAGTAELTGLDLAALKEHLAVQFAEGMTWDNYGEWHIDHIRPCSSFDLTDAEQQRECFHFSNLQPLWAVENLRKGAKLPAAA